LRPFSFLRPPGRAVRGQGPEQRGGAILQRVQSFEATMHPHTAAAAVRGISRHRIDRP